VLSRWGCSITWPAACALGEAYLCRIDELTQRRIEGRLGEKDKPAGRDGPRTGRDWAIAVAGIGLFGALGYLFEGRWISWPLVLYLLALVAMSVRRFRARRPSGPAHAEGRSNPFGRDE
jgi:hypothetical protein